MKSIKIAQVPGALLLGLMLMCAPALAAEKSPARQTLENTLNQVIAVLGKPEFKDPAKNAPLMAEVKEQIYGICDFQEFSRRTLGAYWRSFTPDQQSNFIDVFGSLLCETYKSKLLEYDGQQINFVSEIPFENSNRLVIRTTIPDGDKQIPVDYRMIEKNGVWKVYDMIIENNISLVQNYLGQFQEILSKNKPDYLIDLVGEKAAAAKAKNDAVHSK
ncbi:MAG: ABC transporter substrate-binding protein [Deltaproteobacteria bacterium]|jgi:phospholipid transport system substrate-binding protein|nr:ABC transporter substrate-binding protein [Deltaproteobacteria bacterium]